MMGKCVIKIVNYSSGDDTPFDGQFLVDYDPARPSVASDGTRLPFTLLTTSEREKAKEFESGAAAFDCYLAANGVRRDGKPNRPLTAWTVTFEL